LGACFGGLFGGWYEGLVRRLGPGAGRPGLGCTVPGRVASCPWLDLNSGRHEMRKGREPLKQTVVVGYVTDILSRGWMKTTATRRQLISMSLDQVQKDIVLLLTSTISNIEYELWRLKYKKGRLLAGLESALFQMFKRWQTSGYRSGKGAHRYLQ
jgi:hypothetical protein